MFGSLKNISYICNRFFYQSDKRENVMTLKELKRIAKECKENNACEGNLNKLLYFIDKKDKEKACQILLFHKDWLSDSDIMIDLEQVSKTAKNIGTSWHSNGQPFIEATFKDGQLNGQYKKWYSNGQIDEETTYKDDNLNGEYKGWYEDGQPWVETTYKNGQLDGLYKRWYSNGQPEVEATFMDGVKIN